MEIHVSKLYGAPEKIRETEKDIAEGRTSRSAANPATVSRLDNPRGCFYLMDGYHRVIESIQRGEDKVPVSVDNYIPRIERTGGAYAGMVERMVSIPASLNRPRRDMMENNYKAAREQIKNKPSRGSRLKRAEIRRSDDKRVQNLGEHKIGPFSEWMSRREQKKA